MRIIKLLILTVLTLTITLTMTSCMNNEWLFKDGYFTYWHDNKSGDVVLGGLTEEGMQQETLVFPSIINGKRVAGIGVEKDNIPVGGKIRVHFFESEKLKKIYIPNGYTQTGTINDFYEKLPNVECVYSPKNFGIYFVDRKEGYIPNKFILAKKEKLGNEFMDYYPNYHSANVEYYMNDGTDDIYMVDHVSGTKVNVEPSTPYREWYSFRGWYKDKELTTLWDFENDIIPEIKLDGDGNEIIEVTKIYAGWDLK